MARRVVEVTRRRPLHDVAGVHDRDVVGQLHQQGEVVGDEDHRESKARSQLREFVDDLALGHDVERRRGLVHDDQLGVEGEGEGDHDPLTLTTRELVGETREPVLIETHQRRVAQRRVRDVGSCSSSRRWVLRTSSNSWPMRSTGFRALRALCSTIDTCDQRIARSSLAVALIRSTVRRLASLDSGRRR